MTSRPPRLAWLPPLLVGASAAMVAEVALSLLLYTGPGFVRSLTVVLGVSGLAWAGGLGSAPAPGPTAVSGLRWRWHLCLIAFVIATAFGVGWSVWSPLAEGRTAQAAGLVALAAIPLYAAGSVQGGLAAVVETNGWGTRVGAAGALGAGIGVILTGSLLPRTPLPATVLLSCLVMLSLGGVVFGVMADGTTAVRVTAEVPSPTGAVRLEEHRRAGSSRSVRVLREGAYERRRAGEADGVDEAAWDAVVADALVPLGSEARRVLFVGAGASPAPALLARTRPDLSVHVIERSGEVVTLADAPFATGLGEGLGDGTTERVTLEVGNLEDLVKAVRARYDLVVVDAGVLEPIGGTRGLSREARARLVQAVAPSGALVWGPRAPEDGLPELAAAWPRDRLDRIRPVDEDGAGAGSRDALVVWRRPGAQAPEALSVAGFESRNGAPPTT